MDKSIYFKNLISLYTSSRNNDLNEAAVPIPQNKIADSGSDVNPQNQPATMYEDGMQSSVPDGNEDDGEMLQQNLPEPPQQLDSSKTLEKEKFVKLFGFYEDLLNYGKVFSDSLNTIDINLLDADVFSSYQSYNEHVKELVEKIKDYLENVFNNETYEKVLYTYVLYRTEMISIIKNLRKVLKLDQVQSEDDRDLSKDN